MFWTLQKIKFSTKHIHTEHSKMDEMDKIHLYFHPLIFLRGTELKYKTKMQMLENLKRRFTARTHLCVCVYTSVSSECSIRGRLIGSRHSINVTPADIRKICPKKC